MIKDFIKELKKINPYSEIVEEDTLATITDYISTGSYILNAVVSGDMLNGGVPVGRIVTYSGLSEVGKSLLSAMTAANAQKKGYVVVWFDSEWAANKDFFGRLGVNTKELIRIPVGTVEEFKNQCFKILQVAQEKYPDKKIFFVLDSLGNLPSEKEMNDVESGNNASDMGQRAKVIKNTLKVLTDRLGKQRATLLIINHIYGNPTNPYAGNTQSGGQGPVYVSYSVINFTKSKLKGEEKELIGLILKGTTDKNRLVPRGKSAEILLNFEKGLDKYYGLLDFALEAGLVVKDGKKYKNIKDEKLYWEKDIYVKEFWEPIMVELNKYVKQNFKFSSVQEDVIDENESKKERKKKVKEEDSE